QAGGEVRLVVVVREAEDRREAGGVGVAVERVVAAPVLGGELVAGRGREPELVVAGGQVGEQVVAVGVGGVGGKPVALAVEQADDHAGGAQLARVLDAVGVGIV